MRKPIAVIQLMMLWQPYTVVSARQAITAEPDLRLSIFLKHHTSVTQCLFKPFAGAVSHALNRKSKSILNSMHIDRLLSTNNLYFARHQEIEKVVPGEELQLE